MKLKTLRRLFYSLLFSLLFTAFISSGAYAAGKPAISKAALSLLAGKTYDLNIKNASKGATAAWSSSSTKIATVDKNGLVKGVAKGKVTITCKVKSAGVTYTLKAEINVIAPAKTVSILNDDVQLKVGESTQLNCKVSPSSSNDTVAFSSSDETVAAVDKNGMLTAKKTGIAQITAVTMSGVQSTIMAAVYADDLRIVTADDLNKDKKAVIADQTISNLRIVNSAEFGEITLDHVQITGMLELEAGTDYIVKASNSKIAAVKIITPEDASTVKEKERPTLLASGQTDIWKADLQASAVLKVTGNAKVEGLSVTPQTDGNYDIYVSAYHGDLEVNYDSNSNVRVELEGCSITKADIEKASGNYMVLTSNEGKPSEIGTVNIKTNTLCGLDAATGTVNIDKSLKEAELLVANKIDKLVSNGAEISFSVAEEAYVGELIDNKDSSGKYGNYILRNSDMGNPAFNVRVGERKVEGVQLKDFVSILDLLFTMWTDTSKPFEVPEEPGTYITCIGTNTYQLDFNGTMLTLKVDKDAGALTVFGADNLKITDIGIAKEKEQKPAK